MVKTHHFHSMGCDMLAALDTDGDHAALVQVPVWFEDWEQVFSRFRSDSELSAINRQAGTSTVVSPMFAEVFELALVEEKLSAGVVTPVLLDAVVLAGYDQSFESLESQRTMNVVTFPNLIPNLNEVVWDPANRTILLPPDLHLDFGGLVKGWAAQQALDRLAVLGPALVDAGGDIAISRVQSSGLPWQVGVANPFEPSDNLEILHLGRGGIATSGRDKRRWLQNGVWQHHIIDPRTGYPVITDILTATIVASSVTVAESAAKTILILGSEAGMAWLQANPDLAGMLVLETGQCLQTNNFKTFLGT